MKKLIFPLFTIIAGLSIVTVNAHNPKSSATITLDQASPSYEDTITFTVTQESYALGVLWTAVKCYQDDGLVAVAFQPVGNSYVLSSVDLGGSMTYGDPSPDETQLMNCTAYVWEFPNSGDPVHVHGNGPPQDVVINFTVSP